MNNREAITRQIWETSNHGTCLVDIERAFDAGLASQAQQPSNDYEKLKKAFVHLQQEVIDLSTKNAELLVLQSQAQQEPKENEKAWCEWVATMIGAYLNEPVDSDKCKAIAGIIERRLWGFPKSQAQQTESEPQEFVRYRHSKSDTVWFYQHKKFKLPEWAIDVEPYIPPAPEGGDK